MKMRTLALALALALTGSLGMAQASTPKHPKAAKAAKFKTTKINTKNQRNFQSSHKITKRQKVKAPAKHTARKAAVHKVKPKKHA
ncbi:MAG: hypothetical protein ABSF62_22950 [Bryobacteraceae bacterium]|jgi:hypothetical protein